MHCIIKKELSFLHLYCIALCFKADWNGRIIFGKMSWQKITSILLHFFALNFHKET